MERFAECHTAQELLEFLQSIPVGAREQMPIMAFYDEDQDESTVSCSAYDTYETEGCREIGLQITTGLES